MVSKNKNTSILLIFIVFVLQQIKYNCQIFTNPQEIATSTDEAVVSYQDQLKKLDNKDSIKCYCDRNTNVCDLLCPCDTKCPSDSITSWNKTELIQSNIVKSDRNKEFQSLKFPNCTDIGDQNKSIYSNQVNSLTCILIENLPANGIFYLFQNELQGDAKPRDIEKKYLQDPYAQQEQETLTYIGGKSYVILNSGNQKLVFPGKDGFGYCTNQQPVVYLKDINSKCVKTLKIESSDTTYLNTLWTSLETNLQKIIDDIKSVKQQGDSSTVIQVPDITILKPQLNTQTCTISNLIKQVSVKFILSDTQESISSAEINLEYQSQVIPNCGAINNQSIFYPFISDIKFYRSKDNLDDTTQLKMSGSYGYRSGLKVHIGTYFNDDKDIYINQMIKGYSIVVSDENGNCLNKDAYTYTDTENQISFNQDITFSCKKVDGLDLITDYKIGNYFLTASEIAEPTDGLPKVGYTMFGRYGIAAPSLPLDWIELKEVTTFSNFNKKTTYNQILILIFYSEAGPIGDEQKYIVEAHKAYIQNDKIQDQFNLSVQFIELEYDNLMQTILDPESQINEWIRQIFGGVESQ